MPKGAHLLPGAHRGRPNLKQDVAQHLRDQILSGTLKPGNKIDQDAVAEALGVSRLPVREALITLEAEGLVENVARRGAFVAALEPGDIRDHYEMYGLLSGLAAQRAAHALDEDALKALDETINEMNRTDDPREKDRLNFEFHRIINRAGQSRRLGAALRMLSVSMPTHFFEFNVQFERRSEEEHRIILDALRAQDGDSAARALAEHFRHVGEQAVGMLRTAGYWDDEAAQ